MTRWIEHTPYAGAILTGLLFGFGFPPFPLGVVAWFAFVPLLLRLSSPNPWRAVVAESIIACSIATVIVGYWTLLHPIASARSASLIGLVSLAITTSIPFWVFGIPSKRASLPLRFGLLFVAVAGIEFVQFHSAVGFPLLTLGHTQATLYPLNQLAAVFGAPGLSTWVLISNVFITATLLLERRKARHTTALGYLLFVVTTLMLGYAQSRVERPVVAEYSILAVQPGTAPEAWADVRDRNRPNDLIGLTRSTPSGPIDLMIWPETTLPVLEARDTPSNEYLALASFVDSLGAPLLTGAIFKSRSPIDGPETYTNSAIVMSPSVGITNRYDKRILVPFAEGVPYVDRYPWLARLAVASGGVPGYSSGLDAGRIQYDDVSIGIMICFESAFGWAALDADPKSLAFYVVLTQDGWWGNTTGYRHHFAVTGLRAIETGRAVVQVSVTGITGLALPDGSKSFETEWMERTVRTMDVPAYAGTTLYARIGELPVLLFNMLLLLVAGLFASSRKTASDRTD